MSTHGKHIKIFKSIIYLLHFQIFLEYIYFCRYKEMSHRSNFENIVRVKGNNPKSTIRQFFSSVACVVCEEQTTKEVCPECLLQPSRTILVLLDKIKQLERNHQQIAAVSILLKRIFTST